MTFNFQLESPTELSVLITGNTFQFKSRFDAFGVPMSKLENEGGGSARYISYTLSCLHLCISLASFPLRIYTHVCIYEYGNFRSHDMQRYDKI